MFSEINKLFTIWPILTYTKYEKDLTIARSAEKNIWFAAKQKQIIWFVAEHNKINNSDVKTIPPLDIKWSAPKLIAFNMSPDQNS